MKSKNQSIQNQEDFEYYDEEDPDSSEEDL